MATPRKAFTLMELLIVVAIVSVLVGIVTISLRGVRGAAQRTESLSALRQMGMGYNLYAQEHNGRLLPGYIGVALMATGETFEHLSISVGGGDPLPEEDMQSYVWRLAPYVDDHWQTFFEDADAGAMTRFSEEYQRIATSGQPHTLSLVSELPSFGLNSIFVGGDSVHGGVGPNHPWQDTLPHKASTRLSHALNPAKLIVFAPAAKGAAAPLDVYSNVDPAANEWPGFVGSCEIRAPYLDKPSGSWINQQWFVGANGRVTQAPTGVFGSGGGLPIARTAKNVLDGGMEPIPVVHLDGATAMQPMAELTEDMRRWSQRKDVE